MGKDNDKEIDERIRNKNYEDWDPSFKTYLYNSKTGAVLGRNGSSWAKLTIFYLIFYAGLASFAGLCYYLFSLTLTADRPKWILEESIIGTNPGLGYRPMPDPDTNAESTLIWYKKSGNDTAFWYKQLEDYLNPNETESSTKCSLNGCTYSSGKKASKTACCQIDMGDMDKCSKKKNFGYPEGEPCVLLKLNRILGWEPKGYGIQFANGKAQYNSTLLKSELKHQVKHFGMPETLEAYILGEVTGMISPVTFLSTVWISCSGEGIQDQEKLGHIEYFPQPGIPGYYFPYYKQPGYQSPFIFVKFGNPTPGLLLNIECKAWARNIQHDRANRLGSVHFEMMID